ncbi:MAG: tetratricopeptide repeat protein [Gammaproteobacteria bacterium]
MAPALALLLAVVLSGCAGTSRKADTADAGAIKPVREITAPAAATSTAAHVTPVPATAEVQAMAPAAVPDYLAAINLVRANKLDDALMIFQGISGQYPRLSGPLVNEGLIHLHQGRPQDALDALDRALKANEQNPYAWNLRGVALREFGKFSEARASYERALALDPLYARAHFNLGVLADLYLQDLPLAISHYEKYQALQVKPDQAVGNWISDLRNRSGRAGSAGQEASPANEDVPAPQMNEGDNATDVEEPATAG